MSNKLYWQVTAGAGAALLTGEGIDLSGKVEICNDCHQDLVERRDCGDPSTTCDKKSHD